MTATAVPDWILDGPTALCGYDDDRAYVLIRVDTDDPELQRNIALVGAWDMEGERYARMVAAVPKLLAACQAVVDRWEHGDLAEAARMCDDALAAANKTAETAKPETPRPHPREISLRCFGLTVRLDRQNTRETPGCGTITSDLKIPGRTAVDRLFNAAIDGLESLVLAHACGGVDVASPAYVEGIETAVDAIANHFA
jgi:hypothetical protein